MNTLLYEVKDHVARITLNRPDAANALDMEMARDLMHVSIVPARTRRCAP